MKHASNLSAAMGFSLQQLNLKEHWGAAQRRTVVTSFLGKGARGMVATMGHDEQGFQI
jgi:hypothetical protein